MQKIVTENSIRWLKKHRLAFSLAVTLLNIPLAEGMLFSPPPASYLNGPDIIEILVDKNEVIYARYLYNPDAEYTILYNHGNNEDIGMHYHWLQRFRDKGYSVFTYDYRGFGLSEGKPTEKNTYRDAEAAYDYLVNKRNVDPDKIIVMGRSLGGGVAVELATRKPVAGLIMQSTFISINRVVAGGQAIPFDKYKNVSKIDKVDCPILVIHGTADSLVKFWHGEKLYEEAKQPKGYLWVKGADHEDDIAAIAGNKYWKAIESLTEKIENGRLAKK